MGSDGLNGPVMSFLLNILAAMALIGLRDAAPVFWNLAGRGEDWESEGDAFRRGDCGGESLVLAAAQSVAGN